LNFKSNPTNWIWKLVGFGLDVRMHIFLHLHPMKSIGLEFFFVGFV